MARGQAAAADTNLKTTNAVAAGQGAEAGKLENELVPGYTTLMDTGYMSPQEEEGATNSVMGSATAPFKTADFEAKNRAAATRNPADLTAQQDQLALEEGQTAGEAANTLEMDKLQNQEAGMYGLGDLEKGNLQASTQMYGLGPGTLSARAAGQSDLQQIGEAAGGIGGLIRGIKGKG